MRGGFVHVIDNEELWRVDFARDILAGRGGAGRGGAVRGRVNTHTLSASIPAKAVQVCVKSVDPRA